MFIHISSIQDQELFSSWLQIDVMNISNSHSRLNFEPMKIKIQMNQTQERAIKSMSQYVRKDKMI